MHDPWMWTTIALSVVIFLFAGCVFAMVVVGVRDDRQHERFERGRHRAEQQQVPPQDPPAVATASWTDANMDVSAVPGSRIVTLNWAQSFTHISLDPEAARNLAGHLIRLAAVAEDGTEPIEVEVEVEVDRPTSWDVIVKD